MHTVVHYLKKKLFLSPKSGPALAGQTGPVPTALQELVNAALMSIQ